MSTFRESATHVMRELRAERKINDLKAENARLRELLLDVWNAATQFDEFWDYVHGYGEIYNEDELPHYLERMRELGIEVE